MEKVIEIKMKELTYMNEDMPEEIKQSIDMTAIITTVL